MNPIKEIRIDNQLTQQSFSEACKVSRDVLVRTEAATYVLIPPKILGVAALLSPLSEAEISAAYLLFQRNKRYTNRPVLKGATYKEFREVNGGSVAGFCKSLCLDLSMWTRLENKGGDAGFFLEVLNDCGDEWVKYGRTLAAR